MKPNTKAAFTLVELLTVVAILAVLAAMLFVSPTQANAAERIAWTAHTNITVLTNNDGSNSPAILQARTAPGWRTQVVISNPQGYPVLVDYVIIPTNSADVTITTTKAIIVPASSTLQLDMGGGYNGPLYGRAPSSTNAAPKLSIVEGGN